MELKNLLDVMNERLKTDAFRLDSQGVCRVSIDGRTVVEMMEFPEDDRLLVYSNIGSEPADGVEGFRGVLLDSMFMFKDTFGCTFSRDADTGCIYLQKTEFLSRLEPDGFYDFFETFYNLADNWRRMLDEFRPGAELSARIGRETAEETSEGLANGTFLQV